MGRAAIFVEGQTELEFVRMLVEEMAGPSHVAISEERRRGGIYVSLAIQRTASVRHQILIIDCCGDGAVLSAVRERYAGLEAAGYDLVLGLRDLYPYPLTDLGKIQAAIQAYLPVGRCRAHITIALTEVEAWFIEEESHFSRIDNILNRASIIANMGYDIDNDFAEGLVQPATTLNSIYKIAGKSYNKRLKNVNRTMAAIDFLNLYVTRRSRVKSFDEFVREIENVLAV